MARWHHYVPATVLAVGAAAIWLIGTPVSTPLTRPLAAGVPDTFMGRRGIDVPLGADERRTSGVTRYVNRRFGVDGVGDVMLYVGYHATQQGDSRMHAPDVCLPGAGWTPVDARLAAVPVGSRRVPVNRYVLQQNGVRILVYYWFQGRGSVTAGEGRLKLDTFRDALLFHRDEEALVRIVVPVAAAGDAVTADSVAVHLAAMVIPRLQGVLPPPP